MRDAVRPALGSFWRLHVLEFQLPVYPWNPSFIGFLEDPSKWGPTSQPFLQLPFLIAFEKSGNKELRENRHIELDIKDVP